MTLQLADDAPQHDLPWIITFGPMDEEEEWEPVVCGPYEREHAISLAQHVVADADLLAVVEPLLPATSLEQIRGEIASAQQLAAEEDAEIEAEIDDYLDSDNTFSEEDDLDEDLTDDGDEHVAEAPTPEEIRAGFGRIASRLTQ